MSFAVREASKRRVDGQVGHVTPSAGLFGLPVRAKAPMLALAATMEPEEWKLLPIDFSRLKSIRNLCSQEYYFDVGSESADPGPRVRCF